MAVICSKCGEELLGSVNRCWKCGTEYVSRSGPTDVPPIRRPPIKGPLHGAAEAVLVEDPQSEAEASVLSAGDEGGTGDLLAEAGSQTRRRPMRRGSPFAPPADAEEADEPAEGELPRNLQEGPRRPQYPRHGGAIAGSVLSIVLGLISFGVSFAFPIGAIITGAIGLGMGSWGLYSNRRSAAILGLLLCCIALALAGFWGAVDLYTYMHGYPPWETFDPVAPTP